VNHEVGSDSQRLVVEWPEERRVAVEYIQSQVGGYGEEGEEAVPQDQRSVDIDGYKRGNRDRQQNRKGVG